MGEPQEESSDQAPPANKKSRFGDWSEDDADKGTSPSLGIEEEIELYQKIGRSSSDDPGRLLPWWKGKSGIFRRLARRVLAIPATSASSERTWSRAGLILSEKRTKLTPQKMCDLLVIHNYFLVS